MTNEELIVTYRKAQDDADLAGKKNDKKKQDTAQRKAVAARDELIEQNKRFIYYFARRYLPLIRNASYELDDLVQEAWTAFLDALERFEFIGGNLFITFAGCNIRFALMNFINRKTIDRKDKNNLDERVQFVSLDSIIPGTEDMTISETIADTEAVNNFDNVDFEIDIVILRCDLIDSIESVFFEKGKQERIKNVLLRRYGLCGKEMSFKEIANDLGLCIQAVHQLHKEGLWDLQHSPAAYWLLNKYRDLIIEDLEAEKLCKFKDGDSSIERRESIESEIKFIKSIGSIESELNSIDGLLNSILDAS